MNLKAVIPAKAGIHFAFCIRTPWIPAFAGMTAMRRLIDSRKNLAGQQWAKAGMTGIGPEAI